MTDLERLLADAAAHLDFPPTPDIAGRVEARLTAPAELSRRAVARWWWRAGAAAAAAVLAMFVILAVPATREAVADFLGIGKARVEVVPTLPPTPPVLGAGLDLGEPVSPAEAGALGGGPVTLPERLGEPDAVFADAAGRVTLVYGPRAGLAAAPGSDVGLLVERVPMDTVGGFTKQVTADTEVRFERVKGDLAIWLEGGPHVVFYADPDGDLEEREGRLAGNTLLWADRGFTYRLEGAVDLAEAVAIAESIP